MDLSLAHARFLISLVTATAALTAGNMQAGFFGNVVSSQANADLTVTAGDRRYIEIVKMFGNVQKDIKELSDSLKEIKENVNNIQLELSIVKENVTDKGPVKDGLTKFGRLPKVLTVGKIS